METTIIVAIITFLGMVIASGAMTAWTQYKLSKKVKKDEKEDRAAEAFEKLEKRIDRLDARIDEIDEKIDGNEAKRARTQILRFADEVYSGVLHTKEHFNEILETCKEYNQYCEDHPDFLNMRTETAQERIKEVYRKCEKEHSFLD